MTFAFPVRTSSARKEWASPIRCFSSRKSGSGQWPTVSLSSSTLPPVFRHHISQFCFVFTLSFTLTLTSVWPRVSFASYTSCCNLYSDYLGIIFSFQKVRGVQVILEPLILCNEAVCFLFSTTSLSQYFLGWNF